MAPARSFAALLLLVAAALYEPAQGLEVQHRGGGPAPFLPRFPPFASGSEAQAQAFSRGAGAAFSEAFSSGGGSGGGSGAHAFGDSFASSSAAGATAHGRVFSESAAAASSAEWSSRAFSRSGGAGGAGEGGAFASSHSVGHESGLPAQGQRVSESSSQSSSSGGQSSSSSSSSSSGAGGAFLGVGASSEGVLSAGQRVTHFTPVAEPVPILRPVVPVVEELVPTYLQEQLDAILLTTPVPILEEVNVVPIRLQAGNQVPGHVASQENHQFHSSTSHLNDKRRKPIGPIRGYPSPSNEQLHNISSGSFESHNRESSNSHRESNSHFSSTQHKEQPPVVLIGYQGNQQGSQQKEQSQYGSSEYPVGGSPTGQGQRAGVGQTDSTKNILDALQSFMKGNSHTESHRGSHREAHRTSARDGGAQRITYEAVVTGEAPEVLYQTQVNNVNGVKESFQQSGNSQGNTNINNIISQITRDAAEIKKQQPYFVVKTDQSTSKFSETHGGLSPEQIHMRPHLENIDKVVHPQGSAQFPPNGPGFRSPVTSAGSRDDNDESVTYSKGFHTESHSGNRSGNDERPNGGGKFLTFDGRRYSSDDLAREFNRTRPTFPPQPSPSSPKPPIQQADQAEATTPFYGLQLHPNDKQNPGNAHSSKASNSNSKGVLTQFFGKQYHEFVPPALFDSREFSKFFFDHLRPGQPLPSAADFAQATAHGPSSVTEHVHQPPRNKFPTNYFIYPSSIKHDSGIPDYVTRDMRNMHGSSSSSSLSLESSSSSESESSSSSESGSNFSSQSGSFSNSKSATSKPHRPTRVQY